MAIDKGEVLPADDNWEMIERSVGGQLAQCNSGDAARGLPYLAIRRRKYSNRIDHITQVIASLSI
jgi:hypothetical protein